MKTPHRRAAMVTGGSGGIGGQPGRQPPPAEGTVRAPSRRVGPDRAPGRLPGQGTPPIISLVISAVTSAPDPPRRLITVPAGRRITRACGRPPARA